MIEFYSYDSHPNQYGGWRETFFLYEADGELRIKFHEYDEGPPNARPGDNIEEETEKHFTIEQFRAAHGDKHPARIAFEKMQAAKND